MLNIRKLGELVCSGFRIRDETVAAPFRGTGVPFCSNEWLFLFRLAYDTWQVARRVWRETEDQKIRGFSIASLRRRPVRCSAGDATLDLPQLGYPSDLDPLDDEDIAGVVEAGAVRANELARDEFLAGLPSQRVVPVLRVGVAEVLHHFVVTIDEGDAALEVGYDNQAFPFVEVARQSESLDEVLVLAIEREALQAIVTTIGDDE